jgi:proline iminopeptidase
LVQQSAPYFSAIVFVLCFVFSGCAQNAPVSDINAGGNFAIVNGVKLWYKIEGKGEPLLLIAGGPGMSHSYLYPYFSVLADSYRVVYFDAFGRGKSDRAKSPDEYTFARDVEDIEGICKELNLGKINVFGHSYGGMVAQAYALKYPDSVKRLILANTLFSAEMWQAGNDNCNYEIRNQCPELWEKLQELRAQGLRSSAKEHQEIYYKVPIGLSFFYDASNADKLKLDFNADVYYAIAGDDADFLQGGDIAKLDFRSQLKNLKMPVLILAGRFDRVVFPRLAIQFKQYAPQVEFVMFEKSGHLPFIEEPNMTFEILRKFLSK